MNHCELYPATLPDDTGVLLKRDLCASLPRRTA